MAHWNISHLLPSFACQHGDLCDIVICRLTHTFGICQVSYSRCLWEMSWWLTRFSNLLALPPQIASVIITSPAMIAQCRKNPECLVQQCDKNLHLLCVRGREDSQYSINSFCLRVSWYLPWKTKVGFTIALTLFPTNTSIEWIHQNVADLIA